ncbi:hypothetical protein [Streptomyces sp. NPDC003247]|uniref:hypothetical protein n=1 Tax=Streptomyces sp. NPDC003247 TaxID=3364677 RepID=UPI0036CF8490
MSDPMPDAVRFDGGTVVMTPDGAPAQFVCDADPERRYLLDDSISWQFAEHAWGSGHLVTDRGAGRWNVPDEWVVTDAAIRVTFDVTADVRLTVERAGGPAFTETYSFENVGEAPVRITGIGINTPFADLYENARSAVHRSVHAHVMTGGKWAWVLAQPMSGVGRSLGLIVRDGALHGYSVESRNHNSSSNVRGHVVLHPTDHARNPDAFGGQPQFTLAPGETYRLGWELRWYDTVESFLADTGAPAEFDRLAAQTGEEILVRTAETVRVDHPDVSVREVPGGYAVSGTRHGDVTVSIGDHSHTQILFHDPLPTMVRKRADYIMRYQRATERAGSLAYGLVSTDVRTRLTVPAGGWPDWSDGAERIGMAIMLQLARRLGWLSAEVDEELDGWAHFAREHLLEADYTPRRGSNVTDPPRLYDMPWLSRFYLERYLWNRDETMLGHAAGILERAFHRGIERFLAIGLAAVTVRTATELEAAGHEQRATELRDRLVASARHFVAQGDDLPAHEVAYEQSIIAPLINLYSEAYRLTGDGVFLDANRAALPKLLAFGGPQQHVRLNGIAIRHWDGFWFGLRRQWGDVFPHHWSALTADAVANLPGELRTPRLRELADRILRANMCNYFDDGGATCAFVFPTAVDGEPAHVADPLANDQDWHLIAWIDDWIRCGVPMEQGVLAEQRSPAERAVSRAAEPARQA